MENFTCFFCDDPKIEFALKGIDWPKPLKKGTILVMCRHCSKNLTPEEMYADVQKHCDNLIIGQTICN